VKKVFITIFTFSISLSSSFAQESVGIANSIREAVPQPSAGSILPNTDTISNKKMDTVNTQQTSTQAADCINSSIQGTMCGANATSWCSSHPNTTECNNVNKNSNLPTPTKPMP